MVTNNRGVIGITTIIILAIAALIFLTLGTTVILFFASMSLYRLVGVFMLIMVTLSTTGVLGGMRLPAKLAIILAAVGVFLTLLPVFSDAAATLTVATVA